MNKYQPKMAVLSACVEDQLHESLMSTFHNTVALRMVGQRKHGDNAVLLEEDLSCTFEFSTIINSKERDATKLADNFFVDEFGPPF